MSPYLYIGKDTPYPPCLLAHGAADELVPYSQIKKTAEKLARYGNEVRLLTVTGAPHEDTFWSWPLIKDIFTFIGEHI